MSDSQFLPQVHRLLNILTLFACLASCSGEPVQPETVDVVSVTLEPTTLALKVGEKSTLTVAVLPENASDKTIKWSSDDSSIATVDDGTVTAVAAGETTVKASAGGKTATCKVSVTKEEEPNPGGGGTTKVKISFKGKSLTATFDDNATSRYILNMLPHTFPMLDLYDDEMCYRFSEELPADDVRTYQHELGEIFYWPPGHSFVIRYAKPYEPLTIQHIGQVDSGVEQMAGIGDTDVTFEIIEGGSSSKTLVAYFSFTGTTKGIATTLADVTGADLYEIVPEEAYDANNSNYYDESTRAYKEQYGPATARPAIKKTLQNASGYDVIFLGSPIWYGKSPRLIYSFLDEYKFAGKTVIPFVTSGSSGIGTTQSEFQSTYSDIKWKSGARLNGKDADALKGWVASFNLDN